MARAAPEVPCRSFSLELNDDQTTLRDWRARVRRKRLVLPSPTSGRARRDALARDRRGGKGRHLRPRLSSPPRSPTRPACRMAITFEGCRGATRGSASRSSGPPSRSRGIHERGHARAADGVGSRSASGPPGDLKLAAFGVTEPDAGSDVSSLRTRAVYNEATDEWTLNGQRPGSRTAGSRTCT